AKLQGAPTLVYIGARRSLTGLNADQWIACKPGGEMAICAAIVGQQPAAAAAEASGVPVATIEALTTAVKAAGSGVLALCGVTTTDAAECADMAAQINKANGSVGVTIKPASPQAGFKGLTSYAELATATDKMKAGSVPLAFVRNANPAHTMPKSAGFRDAFAKVAFKVSFSTVPDETTSMCDLVLPDNHWLESWGDSEISAGVISLQQPSMEPVFSKTATFDGTRATANVLIDLAKKDVALASQYNVADFRTWYISKFVGGSPAFATALTQATVSASPLMTRAARTVATTVSAAPALTAQQGEFFVYVYPSGTLGDGQGANKPWLQELPDPVTKIAWQSWVEIHPKTAKRMQVMEGDHLKIETAAGSVTAAAYIYMGVREDTVAVSLGQGHTAYGRYAMNVGVNAYDLVPSGWDAAGGLSLVTKGKVTKTADHSQMVTTEGSARQHGRGIGQAMDVAELSGPAAEEHEHDIPGLPSAAFLPGLKSPVAADAQGDFTDLDSKALGMYAPDHSSHAEARRWAMTIDLARCTGCSACVTACYSENNIPTVGAPYQGRALSPGTWDERPGANIIKGREMAWLRIERYYEGNENTENEFSPDFDTRFVPMMCQQCGNAPCEPVCPVYATYHSPDGLNVQVYNRCVGTRYCSNNCPYKVRYFNWFGYGEPERKQYAWPSPMHWGLNPDVTVRGKGVMEKCTFCVQRIREAEHRAAAEGRPVKADEFTTACASACASRAIIFGDAADADWSVAKMAYDRRAYHVFEELNTFTAVVYLKKVNHPAPAASARA
ncbi:MAG: 4Fe-4S dicluster domain-containing protein, partial [Gemmatimonadaceae bacterium]